MIEANHNPADKRSSDRLLILVDQFEEVFTLCHNEEGTDRLYR